MNTIRVPTRIYYLKFNLMVCKEKKQKFKPFKKLFWKNTRYKIHIRVNSSFYKKCFILTCTRASERLIRRATSSLKNTSG